MQRAIAASLPGTLDAPVALSRSAVASAAVITGAALVRVALAATLGLTDTEAYYAAWSRFPSTGYYDHPPMIAWMIWLTTKVSDSAAAVRFGPILCGVAFAALVYRFSERLFTPRAGFFAVVIVTALPVVTATGLIANPESPLLPIWIVVLWLTYELRADGAWWRPLALGAAVGAAFLCKFTGVVAVPIALLYLATSTQSRRWFLRPSLYLGGVVALAVAAPVWWWNHRHGWPSLQLHLVDRMPVATGGEYGRHALRLAAGQLIHFHPLMGPGLLAAAALALKRAGRDARYRLLAAAGAPVLVFFFAIMVRATDAEPHWPMVAYVPLAIAAAAWLDEVIDDGSAALRAYVRACLGVSVTVTALCVLHARSPVLLGLLPPGAAMNSGDPVNETLGWDALRAAIASEARWLGEDAVLASCHNVLCGHLLTETRDAPHTFCVSPTRTAFDFVGRRTPPRGATVLYVDSARFTADPEALLDGYRCEDTRRVPVARGPRDVAVFRLAVCVPRDAPTIPSRRGAEGRARAR